MVRERFNNTVQITRPVRLPHGEFATMQLAPFPLEARSGSGLTVVRAQHPLEFLPPPALRLDTKLTLQILELLEYAGIYYLTPECPAALEGVDVFNAGRAFALEFAPEWIGFDWDYTTNVYKIYGPLPSLMSIKLFRTPPSRVRKKSIRMFEAAKPGMHELIMGMAVGYALRQGLRSFDQWGYYKPQVRLVTQTWPDRLARLGTAAFRIIPLMMGRFPGKTITDEDVRASDAFITLDDFLRQITDLLERFQKASHRFHILAAREQDEVMELLRAGKAYKLKPLSTFSAKGWMPPPIVFDDSPTSNERLAKEGVRVVSVLNPVVPGKDISELNALTFMGRKAAARHMINMVSLTEGHAMIDALNQLKNGAKRIVLNPSHLTPTPKGSVVQLHDISGSIAEVLIKFREPQYRINSLIKNIIRAAGGLTKLERDYVQTAAMRENYMTSKSTNR